MKHATSPKLTADSNTDENMAEQTPPPVEPSMEEILASIRKIISDDDKPEQSSGVEDSIPSLAVDDVVQSMAEPGQPTSDDESFNTLEALVSSGLTRVDDQQLPAPEDASEEPADVSPPEEVIEESIDDLRALKRSMASASIEQQLEEQALQNDIIFEDDTPEDTEVDPEQVAQEEAASSEPDAPVSNVLNLTQMINEDGSITDVNGAMDVHAPVVGVSSTEDMASEMIRLADTGSEDGYGLSGDQSDDNLIANDALELVMVKTLRPMLKKWMEENLPTIVERVVKEEMRRRPK